MANDTRLRTRLLRPHRPDCYAVGAVENGDWTNPWWFPGKTVKRDALGREHEHSWRNWLVLECNSTECDAALLVSVDDVLDLAEREVAS